MDFSFVTEPADFVERPNRFRVHVRLHSTGTVVAAHCPDPGRLRELLRPGAVVHVSRAGNPARKTAYDLRFVEHPDNGQLVSLDSRLPNALFREALAAGIFPSLAAPRTVAAEVPLPVRGPETPAGIHSRIDYRLVDADGVICWVEVKSANLVEEGVARFPDAPTERGQRHVNELAARPALGERAAVVFVVQRPDAQRLEPHWATDPAFARALDAAGRAGVELLAATCRLTLQEMAVERLIPVVTAPPAP